jgi:hypothetical protein
MTLTTICAFFAGLATGVCVGVWLAEKQFLSIEDLNASRRRAAELARKAYQHASGTTQTS